jgi:hypothetical protein
MWNLGQNDKKKKIAIIMGQEAKRDTVGEMERVQG